MRVKALHSCALQLIKPAGCQQTSICNLGLPNVCLMTKRKAPGVMSLGVCVTVCVFVHENTEHPLYGEVSRSPHSLPCCSEDRCWTQRPGRPFTPTKCSRRPQLSPLTSFSGPSLHLPPLLTASPKINIILSFICASQNILNISQTLSKRCWNRHIPGLLFRHIDKNLSPLIFPNLWSSVAPPWISSHRPLFISEQNWVCLPQCHLKHRACLMVFSGRCEWVFVQSFTVRGLKWARSLISRSRGAWQADGCRCKRERMLYRKSIKCGTSQIQVEIQSFNWQHGRWLHPSLPKRLSAEDHTSSSFSA